MPTALEQVRATRATTWTRANAIARGAAVEHRYLTTAEQADYDAAVAELDQLDARIADLAAVEQRAAGAGAAMAALVGSGAGRPTLRSEYRLTPSESLRSRVAPAAGQPELSLDRLVRGMATGDWTNADAERRVLAEGTSSAGGVLVPAPLATDVLDLARAQMRVIQAGATTVPMTSSTLKVPRQTGDPTLTWHTENAAISDSDLTFDAVTLTAHTLPVLVKLSLELAEDVPNLDQVITRALSAAIAEELDRVALRGSGTDPEPTGLLNQSDVSVTSMGTNGGSVDFDDLVSASGTVADNNFTPTAIIYAPRTDRELATLKDTTGQYLAPPTALANVRRLTTTQIPVNLTQGTATNASEIYVGDFSQLLVGMRTSFTIRRIDQAFLDNGQIGFFAYIRADVALAHTGAFALLTGVVPPA